MGVRFPLPAHMIFRENNTITEKIINNAMGRVASELRLTEVFSKLDLSSPSNIVLEETAIAIDTRLPSSTTVRVAQEKA